ncbi:hypothetical protein ACIQVL_19605 [Streptomyces sp. NPDC090499]
MQFIGLAGLRLPTKNRSMVPDQSAPKAPDLIGWNFIAQTPNTTDVR